MSGKRPIVIGATGSLGRALAAQAEAAGMGPLVTTRKGGEGTLRFDAQTDDLTDVIPGLGAGDCVYLALGLANPNWVHAHPAEARACNVDATLRVLDRVLRRGARAVFFSTEIVFDGKTGGYDESSAPNPLTEYGRQKLEVERHLRSRGDDWIIVRIGATVTESAGDNCAVEKTYASLLAPDARMAPDNVISLTPARSVVDALLALRERGERGIYHLVSEPPVTRVELASWIVSDSRFASRMRFTATPYDNIPFPEPRPARSFMVSRETSRRLAIRFADAREAVRHKVALLDVRLAKEMERTLQ